MRCRRCKGRGYVFLHVGFWRKLFAPVTVCCGRCVGSGIEPEIEPWD